MEYQRLMFHSSIRTCPIWAITHETNTILGLLGSDDLIQNMAAQNEWAETYTRPILPQPTFAGATPSENMLAICVPNSTHNLSLSAPYLSLA